MTIERGVSALPGITEATLNFTTGRLRVAGDVDPDVILRRVTELGYGAVPFAAAAAAARAEAARPERGAVADFAHFMLERASTRLTLVGLALILPGVLFEELLPVFGVQTEGAVWRWLALVAMVVAGFPVARSGWRALLVNRQITINLLMTIAAVGAVVIGAWTEAGLVMVLFALGEALEGYAAGRARRSLTGLLELAPGEALVLRPCQDCREHLGQGGYMGGPCPFCGLEEQRLAVGELVVGDLIVVKPGGKVAMDGRITEGRSQLNQAAITGESLPVDKGPGGEVFAGSINGDGVITVEVTHLAADSTISRMIRLVEEAQERRAPVQRAVDRFAAVYTPAVVGVALLVAILPPLFGAPFWGTQGWLYRALELLVVACPCALVISTPVTLVSAISRAARAGVLVKGGSVLQVLAQVNAIAFDKTGTLTQGRPQVQLVRSLECELPGAANISCGPCDDLLALAYAVERRSEHALARAVMDHAAAQGVDGRYPAAVGVQALPGRGVGGAVNGRPVFVGSHAYFDAAVPHDEEICRGLAQAANHGHTPLLLSVDDRYAGYILVADQVRAEAPAALADLRKQGIKTLVMVTGDGMGAAQAAAGRLGISEVRAQVLPAEKVEVVQSLKVGGRTVAMVGDGVNDAPALAAADVGIAMGAGTAQAMETADVVLMGDSLGQLPNALRIARRSMTSVRDNVLFSVGIKLLFFVLVLVGLGSMWMAVVADVGASLLVTLNGLRLLRMRLSQAG